jgi:hypothetical protein
MKKLYRFIAVLVTAWVLGALVALGKSIEKAAVTLSQKGRA